MIMSQVLTLWTGFAASAYVHTASGYEGAFILGTIIGLERQWRQRSAGLRANVLVAVGAAAFADLGFRLLGTEGATRIISYVNTPLRPLVNWVNRRPIQAGVTEAKYSVHAICHPRDVADVRDLLDVELDRANFPVRQIEMLSDSEGHVELAAVLVPTTAEDVELDAVVTALEVSPLILSATWSVEATS
jgi:putative Mg2+ transporter-C (MgtC) family protein